MIASHSYSVTFLLADPGDSLALWEQHPAAMQAALPRFRAALEQAVKAHAGEVLNYANDTLQAVFHSAPQAVDAALQAQLALLAIPWELPLRPRMALLTGSAARQANEYLGPAPHRVARLISVAHSGQILLCPITAELARDSLPEGAAFIDLGEHRLPDLSRPERLYQLAAPGIPADFLPLKSLDNRSTNLPIQPYDLVGRQPELQAVTQQLRSSAVRLLTLTGIGGTGKTRLALQAAGGLFSDFADGIYFAPLDKVADPDLVASAIAQALSLELSGSQPVLDEVKAHLHERRTLLVLDNFEHLIPAASLVSELLATCPQLKILVTSREALRLREEREFPVSPLPLPDPHRLTAPEQLTQYASVALFIQRAQAVRPDFGVDNHNAPAVAEICTILDGLPLAIELAAARVRVFSPQALLARLKAHAGLGLLSAGPRDLPDRQQTMQNALNWSYNLLNPEEQALFRRLGVFVGGFTPEAAAEVCYLPGEQVGDVIEALTSLVEKSLVLPAGESEERTRFSMLYVLQQFAVSLMEEESELDACRRAHAEYFQALAKLTVSGRVDKYQATWISVMEREHNNLRASLRWAISVQGAEAGLMLADTLSNFWLEKGYLREGSNWLELVLKLANIDTGSMELHANVLFGTALILWDLGSYSNARDYLEQCLELRRQLNDSIGTAKTTEVLGELMFFHGDMQIGAQLLKESSILFRDTADKKGLATSLVKNSWVAIEQKNYSLAQSLLEESLKLVNSLGNRAGISYCLASYGILALAQKDYVRAKQCFEDCYQIYVDLGMTQHSTVALTNLGLAHLLLNDPVIARSCLNQAMREHRESGYKRGVAEALEGLASIAGTIGDAIRAAKLFGAAEALREEINVPLLPSDHAVYDPLVKAARSKTTEEVFTMGWAAGREMLAQGLDKVIAYALEPDELPVKQSTKAAPGGLTSRESEILRLVAQGLADAQIAEQLFISPRTVNAHLTSIYSKLGVNSRAAATRFAVENGLA